MKVNEGAQRQPRDKDPQTGRFVPRTLDDCYEVQPDGCWRWTATMGARGYGIHVVSMRPRKRTGAHRAVYEEKVGPIPAGLQIDHLCRNHGCVNPDHLEPVSSAENVRRGRSTKISAADAEFIRTSRLPGTDLAERFGISAAHVSAIRNRRWWTA